MTKDDLIAELMHWYAAEVQLQKAANSSELFHALADASLADGQLREAIERYKAGV